MSAPRITAPKFLGRSHRIPRIPWFHLQTAWILDSPCWMPPDHIFSGTTASSQEAHRCPATTILVSALSRLSETFWLGRGRDIEGTVNVLGFGVWSITLRLPISCGCCEVAVRGGIQGGGSPLPSNALSPGAAPAREKCEWEGYISPLPGRYSELQHT